MKCYPFYFMLEGEIASGEDNPFEETIRIYFAESQEEARIKAEADIKVNEISYKTNLDEIISWKLYLMRCINEIDTPISDGEEVFFRSLTKAEAISITGKIEE